MLRACSNASIHAASPSPTGESRWDPVIQTGCKHTLIVLFAYAGRCQLQRLTPGNAVVLQAESTSARQPASAPAEAA